MSDALSRTRRALDLIPYILEHQGISMDELADRFNISTEVLYEDLNLLFCCGLPGYTPLELIDISFDDGVVSVSNPQELDKPRKLSKQELLRLYLGLDLLAQFAPEKLMGNVDSLRSQISDLLKAGKPIEILNDVNRELVRSILNAINNNDTLSFEYASANSDTLALRSAVPLSINQNTNGIYLEGVELSTNSQKVFRLDRMKNLTIGEPVIGLSEIKTSHSTKLGVELHVDDSAQGFLIQNSQLVLESHKVEGGYRVILREVSENWIISEVFAYGGLVSLLSPTALAEKISELAINRLKNT